MPAPEIDRGRVQAAGCQRLGSVRNLGISTIFHAYVIAPTDGRRTCPLGY
jgi:hypothetical protein